MYKSLTRYGRVYEMDIREGSHGRISATESSEDNILSVLHESIIHLNTNYSRGLHSFEDANYLWFDGEVLSKLRITREMIPAKFKVPKDGGYMTCVSIETMPAKSSPPKELTDLLTSKGFEKLD